ncbi:MAG: RluA family pseudouridine synthase [Deltaproteobacteria bacterium]|nr:RluA family pseudouridine synthase [Deltaproteobacteria bacterium]
MGHWIVTAEDGGTRLDLWLAQRAGMSRKLAKQQLDAGRVAINGRRVAIAKWSLKAGDRVACHAARTPQERERRLSHRRIDVLFEDRDLIAVAKAPGMLAVATSTTSEPTMVDQVRAYLRRRHPGARGTYARPLHRLDRDTSGILLLAKSRAGEGAIALFKAHKIAREYLAIVRGGVEQSDGTIDLPLTKGEFGHGRKVMPAACGKSAVTHFHVEERYPAATLLRLRVETGRTHQIRVHCAAIGHPVLGDRRYGPPDDPLPVERLTLHAARLAFRHPVTGAKVDLALPLPDDLTAIIEHLRETV